MQVRQSGAHALILADFLPLEAFLSRMQDSLADGVYPVRNVVRFERFLGVLPASTQFRRGLYLDPSVVWMQIRSFIKGSIEAAMAGRPLTLDEYLALAPERCRLTPDQRREAYAIFEVYEGHMMQAGLWDESGRVLDTLSKWLLGRQSGAPVRSAPYDRVYVDEVQDCTQAEIALFFVAADMDMQALFLAGDPAQAVAEGVDFRFEEVRSVVYSLSQGRERLERPVKLAVNYRSHSGILNCASGILSKMFVLFPGSAKVLEPDRGLFTGPLPAFWQASSSSSSLQTILSTVSSERLVFICPDKKREELASLSPERLVLGIREAKGLEFAHVAVVDFFCSLAFQDQAAWVRILGENRAAAAAAARDNPQVESQLKLLYTAVTRSSRSLIFVETAESVAGTAFCLWLETMGLGEPLAGPDSEIALEMSGGGMLMSSGEQLAQGLELAVVAASEESLVARESLLSNAAKCFERAGVTPMIIISELCSTSTFSHELSKNKTSYWCDCMVAHTQHPSIRTIISPLFFTWKRKPNVLTNHQAPAVAWSNATVLQVTRPC
jgi:hypothetical protein